MRGHVCRLQRLGNQHCYRALLAMEDGPERETTVPMSSLLLPMPRSTKPLNLPISNETHYATSKQFLWNIILVILSQLASGISFTNTDGALPNHQCRFSLFSGFTGPVAFVSSRTCKPSCRVRQSPKAPEFDMVTLSMLFHAE